jgi:hypothetical protein
MLETINASPIRASDKSEVRTYINETYLQPKVARYCVFTNASHVLWVA